jgi:hypothetical protein
MYNHDKFMDAINGALSGILRATAQNSPKQVGYDALVIVGKTFELIHEINSNLNRIALAQEASLALQQADYDDFVSAKINEGVEKVLAERPKRDYIGKRD